MVPIVIANGAVSYRGAATMQFFGGGGPGVKSFVADNLDSPGDMFVVPPGPFNAVVTAKIGGVTDIGYTGSVALTCTAKPIGSGDPTILVGGVIDAPITGWAAGVSTDTIELFLVLVGMYTFQLDDGVTISSFDVEGIP